MQTIWIITAMWEEADLIIEKYALKEVLLGYSLELVNKKWTLTIFHWTLWEKNIVLLLGWIWKIQASFSTTHLLENYKIDYLINIWIAWNISKNKINIWDVILPNTFIQHDMYLPFPWEHLNYAKKEITLPLELDINQNNIFKIHQNLICLTWDQFIDDENIISKLKQDYSWDLVEMEAFAILSIARNYWILDKTIVIKWISDWANNEAIDAHMSNLEVAMKNSIVVLDEVLKKV
jgi:adenosylhomocysteine nucleosidase